MRVLVTGASGYLGNKLTHKLAETGFQVNALVRSTSKAELLNHPNIKMIIADIMDRDSLREAMQGCDQVYHTAAKVGAWTKNPEVFYTVNVKGTQNVMEIAIESGIKKVVYTSTCGVLGPAGELPLTEESIRPGGFGMDYDLSKKAGEDTFFEYVSKGINGVAVLPPKFYGPGQVSHSLTGNALIAKMVKKGIALVPAPGTYKVSFAFIDDIVNGHILAMEKGRNGERYILGGENISYIDFFARVRTLSNTKGRIIPVSKAIVKAFAHIQMLRYKWFNTPPPFAPESVDYVYNNFIFSSEKADRELGYTNTPLDDALNRTIRYIHENFK